MRFTWKKIFPRTTNEARSSTRRRPNRMSFSWDDLESRTVLSHGGGFQHLHDVVHVSSGTTAAVTAAQKTLQTDVQAILSASGTTVAQLSASATSFETLKTDGLTPTSHSALTTLENSLVTSFASGTTLTGNATLLAQFEALYTTTPTTQQTTDLTVAYNALASAVTSSNITSANITTITADYAAVLKAEGSTSTATYPFFSLVTGGRQGFGEADELDSCESTGSGTSTAVSATRKTLQTDVQAILSASGTTVAQLSAIATSRETLKTDGLTPTSHSALTTLENSLVTSFASGTTLTGNATLLAQFEALYTTTPTTQTTTDLTAAYNALASAVTSSNITSANITTITADYAAVLKAEGSTSTATYPFFSLVTGGRQGFGRGHHG